MTTYMTQKQATAIVHSVKRAGDYLDTKDLCNAAIQAYRDSLADGVVLPEPVGYLAWKNGNPCWEGDDCVCEDAIYPVGNDDDRESKAVYTADQLRQGIADALAKQEKYWQTQVAAALNGKFEPLSGKQVPQWLPIETAPTSEDAPFMVFVPRDSIGDGVAVQVSMFEGRLYPDGKDSCIDWNDAITSATHWATRLETPITKAAK